MAKPLAFKPVAFLAMIALLIGSAAAFGGKALLRAKLESELHAHGIGVAGGPAWPTAGLGFQDVKLDADGDNSIGVISAAPDWRGTLSGQPFAQIRLSHVALIGTLDGRRRILGFDGVAPGRLMPFPPARDVLLDDGLLDLDTPSGALRFAMKGRATRQPDGSEQIDGVLQGTQLQLTADTHWSVNILTDGRWGAVADIRDARFTIPPLAAARMNGWIGLKGTQGQPVGLQGELSAGQVRLGAQLSLGDVTASLGGQLGAEQVALRGAVNAFPGMVATVEYLAGPAPALHAIVAGGSADQLLAFLGAAQADLPAIGFRPPAGVTAPDNLAHAAKAARKVPHATAFLTIDGSGGQLNEKLTVRQMTPSGPQDTVISLDPK